MDSAAPLAIRSPDGGAYEPLATHHTQVSHYCYPSPGIEMVLGALPVVTCNRWHPEGDIVRALTSAESYASLLAAWDAEQKLVTDEAREAEELIAMSLENAAKETP